MIKKFRYKKRLLIEAETLEQAYNELVLTFQDKEIKLDELKEEKKYAIIQKHN